MDLKKTIIALCTANGVSGAEESAAEVAAGFLSQFGEVSTDRMGNVIGKISTGGKKHILLDAHVDQIGLIVTRVGEAGFLHFAACGGMDRRVVLGKPVAVIGREKVRGIIACTPPHLAGKDDKLPELGEMVIDTGLDSDTARQLVAPGDRIVIDQAPCSLLGDRMASPALDDRSGVAAILRSLELVQGKRLDCSLTVVFSVREEVNGAGAAVSAFTAAPDEAVVVDVGHATIPGAPEDGTGKMGGGVMIGFAPTLDYRVSRRMVELAKKEGIPYQYDVMNGRTGTNADQISVAGKGVAAGVLSIPLKYMHTPVEVIRLEDVEQTARLLAAYILEGGVENG